MTFMAEPLGVILAGGQSKRMGSPKATVLLSGKPLLLHVADAFTAAGLEVAVVAKRASELPPSGLPLVEEADSPVHPLHGIVTALRAAAGRDVVVCACDMPLVPAALLAHLARQGDQADVIVPSWRGELQPLCARYGASALPLLAQALAQSASVKAALGHLDARLLEGDELASFGDPDVFLADADDPLELQTLAGQIT